MEGGKRPKAFDSCNVNNNYKEVRRLRLAAIFFCNCLVLRSQRQKQLADFVEDWQGHFYANQFAVRMR